MTTHEAIPLLKARIKGLAATQKKDKASRKGCPVDRQSSLWYEIYRRSAEITACLNFYLTIRGKEDHHKISAQRLHEKYIRELNEKLGGVPA